MTSSIKLTIQKKDGSPAGPYHWKHIVEWHEFELMKDFYWTNLDGELQPVSDLVDALGVPPTICTHTILHSPKHHKPNTNSEIMRKLKVIGFSKDIQSVDDDLGKHLLKRLLMSDEALNAEDPDFQVKNPESYPTVAAQAPSDSTGGEDSVNPSPQNMTDKPEMANDDAPQPKASIDTSKLAVDPTLNPFIEGDEVTDGEALDEHFSPVKKSGFKRVFVVPLLLIIAIGAGAYVYIEQQKQAQTPEAPADDTPPAAPAETPLSEAAETVEEVVTEVVETAEAITSDIQETVETTVEDVKEAVEDTVTEKVSEAEEMIESATKDALSNLSNDVKEATGDTELPTDEVDDAVDAAAPELDDTVEGIEVDEDVDTMETVDTVEVPEVESEDLSTTTEDTEDAMSTAITDKVASNEDVAGEASEMKAPESSQEPEGIESDGVEPSETSEDTESNKVESNTATEEIAVDETETSTPLAVEPAESSEQIEEDKPAKASSIVIDSTGETVEVSDLPSSAQAKRDTE
ncbi:MAG: hypothetical protein ACSHX8_12990 [Opitutaceae bacterium]